MGPECVRGTAVVMMRLNLIVEGQTEETFAEWLLKEPLSWNGIGVYPQLVETSRDKRTGRVFKGGLRRTKPYSKVREHIKRWMNQDKNADAIFSTMFDYYKFPVDLPGWDTCARTQDPYENVRLLESFFKSDISDDRFIPYVQLHEFEALLLCAPEKIGSWYLDSSKTLEKLIEEVRGFQSAEEIDDGELTAPSKRIMKYFPGYERERPAAARAISQAIGLEVMRKSCRHFDEWLVQIEARTTSVR